MRIAVLCHALQTPEEAESYYMVGLLARKWREDGHDVDFVFGTHASPNADVALIHVDLSRVPRSYIKLGRRQPKVLNDRIRDIRKTRTSPNLVGRDSDYDGPVIVKTDLNSAGIPERKLLPRGRWYSLRRKLTFQWGPEPPLEYVKRYSVFDRFAEVPPEVLAPGTVVEKYRPEIIDGIYYNRRCFMLGERVISNRMGYGDPFGESFVAGSYSWIDNDAVVVETARSFGLDYGVVDYTLKDGEAVVFDINKTIGIGRLEDPDERSNYEQLVDYLAPGIFDAG